MVLVTQLIKRTTFVLGLALLPGCAAPPPVKIASHLIGRGLLKKAKDEAADTGQSEPDATSASQASQTAIQQ